MAISEASIALSSYSKYILQYMITCMLKHLTITEARQQLLDLPDKLKDEPVIITRHGKPVMAAISFEQFESLLETLSILSDREFAHQLQESIAQGERGETVSWEEAKGKLGL